MSEPSDKIMFEIYRDGGPDGRFRAVYYTELDEHGRDREIQRALAGESVYDGFLNANTAAHGKLFIERWIQRLNQGSSFDVARFEAEIGSHLVR